MKNKKTLLGLILVVVILFSAALFVSCNDEGNPNTGKGEVYYLYENGELNKSDFIRLNDGKWSDDDNESGSYVLSGTSITIYLESNGEKEEFATGTLKDGVLTLTIMGTEITYCKEGKTPSVTPSTPDEPQKDDGHSIISAAGFEISDITLKTITISLDGTYDLRDRFAVSKGATWRAFSSAECAQPTEITKRIATIEYGWNDVYVLVENQTTYESTVYNLKIYRAPVSSLKLENDDTYEISKGVDFPEVIIPSEYNGKIITAIGDSAFYNCNRLTSITIPSSVTSIGDSAFNGCSGLENIYITDITAWCKISNLYNLMEYGSNSKKLYLNNELIIDLVIPDSVTSIGESAFYNCNRLTSITIGNGVTSIGNSAFWNCCKLVEVINNSSLKITKGSLNNGYVAYYALNVKNGGKSDIVNQNGYLFYANNEKNYLLGYSGNSTDLKLPETYNGNNYEIYKYAFKNRSELTNVEISDRVVFIGDEAFYGCNNLESITLPFIGAQLNGTRNTHFGYIFGASSYYNNSEYVPSSLKTVIISNGSDVVSIGDSAFENCSGLTSVTIGSGVTSIGDSAFENCSGLTSVTIGSGVTSIGDSAFENCSGLTSVTIGSGVTSIGGSAFENCSGLTSVTIPDGVTSIGDYAFSRCSGLTSITIGNGVISIGDCAFSSCSGLTSVTIPDGVTSIGECAFSSCSGLMNVTVGDKVTSIRFSAFGNCSKLESITLPFADTYMGYIFGSRSHSNTKETRLIPSSLKTVIISSSSGVTSIGDYAFYDFGHVTSITIPDSVNSIGKEAFCRCSELESITLPFIGASKAANKGYDQVFGYIFGYNITTQSDIPGATYQWYVRGSSYGTYYHYYIPSSLKNVILSDCVTSIGGSAFYNCRNLTNITISDSVTSIAGNAFYGCSGLKYNEYDNGLYLGNGSNPYVVLIKAKSTNITSCMINEKCKFIHSSAFWDCGGLTSITIPDSVTSIGSYAFEGCSGLKYNEYDNGLYLGNGSNPYVVLIKAKSTNITSCMINEKCNFIHSRAFDGYSGLTSITIPDSVTSIGSSAFWGCSGLTSITIPSSVTSIGSYAFEGCRGLTSITIPDSVTSIGDHSFSDCSGLTNINIPDSITTIHDFAFWGCRGLTSVTIPDSVTSIGFAAFEACSGLTSVTIGNGVTSMGDAMFWNCSKLTEIRFNGTISQWEAISKGYSWDYKVPSSCKVICTDGTISL